MQARKGASIAALTVIMLFGISLSGCSGASQSSLTPANPPAQPDALALRPRSTGHVPIREFALPNDGSVPFNIALGPDGNMWFTEIAGNRVGRITFGGAITEFALPHAGSSPVDIAAGPDGNMWFTEGAGRIGRITPAGKITEFSNGLSAYSSPNGITAGTNSLWFTEVGEAPYGIKIGKITTGGTIVKQYSIPTAYNSNPQNIALGWGGKLWIAEANAGNAIGRSTLEGKMTIYTSGLSGGAYPQGITAGPDGNVWFTESGRPDQIGTITRTGTITEFSAGISKCGCNYNLYGIAVGPDGNLWFTETATNKIARITTAGKVTEFSKGLSADSGPLGITAGLRGTLWFVEGAGNRIGRLKLNAL